jgi:catechol 2,3-dioxygenase-like lactoylglutathione lyase family enzyme
MKLADHLRLGALHQIGLTVSDLDRAVAFYRDSLELPLIARFDQPGLAFFDLGGTRLMLTLPGSEPPVRMGTLYFRVADLDAAYHALLDRGIAFEHGPAHTHLDEAGQFGPAGESEWMAFFRDPSGNLLALAARRR